MIFINILSYACPTSYRQLLLTVSALFCLVFVVPYWLAVGFPHAAMLFLFTLQFYIHPLLREHLDRQNSLIAVRGRKQKETAQAIASSRTYLTYEPWEVRWNCIFAANKKDAEKLVAIGT